MGDVHFCLICIYGLEINKVVVVVVVVVILSWNFPAKERNCQLPQTSGAGGGHNEDLSPM